MEQKNVDDEPGVATLAAITGLITVWASRNNN